MLPIGIEVIGGWVISGGGDHRRQSGWVRRGSVDEEGGVGRKHGRCRGD